MGQIDSTVGRVFAWYTVDPCLIPAFHLLTPKEFMNAEHRVTSEH